MAPVDQQPAKHDQHYRQVLAYTVRVYIPDSEPHANALRCEVLCTYLCEC